MNFLPGFSARVVAHRNRWTFFPIALILLGQLASAATYYVATNGNDSNSGTITAPFATLQQAVNKAAAGDTVIVRNGTYGNNNAVTGGDGSSNEAAAVTLYNSGTASAPITIQAENKGSAILDCQNLCDSYINLYNASYIVIQNLVITRGYKEGIHSNDAAHNITLRGNTIEYIANRSSTATYGMDGMYANPNCHDFIIDGNVFHDIGRTNSFTNSLDHGLYLHGTNFTITNNIFYNINHGWSIQMADGLSNVLVANNTFAFPAGQGGQIMLWNTQNNLTIQNNIFYNPTSYAITRYASTVNSCTLSHNIVYGAASLMSDATGCTATNTTMGANPMFMNASTAPYDFHVQKGGPGIDSGMNIGSVPRDHDWNLRPQGSSTDVGAYEYVVTNTPPAPVISGVFVSGIQTGSAVLNWSTDQASNSSAQYGLSSYTNSSAVNSTMVTQHSATLSNLSAATTYHFRVASTNATGSTTYSSDYTFATATVALAPLAFSLNAAASPLSITQGQSGTDVITGTLLSGTAASVSFSASTLPAGVTASFSKPSCTVSCSTTLTLTAAASATPGAYAVNVTGSNGSASSSASISIAIAAPVTLSTTGLEALWDFGEQSGTIAGDSSGNGNTATLSNVTWASNVCYACASLNGSSSYGSVKESASLETTTQMTVTMWLRPNAATTTDPRVVSKVWSWDIKLNGGTKPQFSVGGTYAMMNTALNMGQWQHVVFTMSNGVVKGYVNGAAVTLAASTFTSGFSIPLQAYGLYLGTDSNKVAWYSGYMDDVRIYNRALSGGEVATLYSTTRH